MYVLVKSSKINDNLVTLLSRKNLIPIHLYEISYTNKNQFRQDLDKTKQLKNKQKPAFSAILVEVLRIDNNFAGFIESLKNTFDIIIGQGGLNKVNRYLIESTNIDFLLDPHNSIYNKKFNFIHHFNSGLNHVLINLAIENNVYLMNSLNFLDNDKETLKDLGRVNQNQNLARNKALPVSFVKIIESEQDILTEKEVLDILNIFNISTEEKQNAIKTLSKVLSRNKLRKSDKFISDGIEIM